MLEPVAGGDFLLFFFDAALVILSSFGYALLYALAKLHHHKIYGYGAFISYGILLIATAELVILGRLKGFWQIMAVLLPLGYGLAPLLIWRLCVETHKSRVD